MPLSQHPFGHEFASQTHCPVDVLHSCPVAHAIHGAPPAPHEVLDSLASASHVVPLKQPMQVGPSGPPSTAASTDASS